MMTRDGYDGVEGVGTRVWRVEVVDGALDGVAEASVADVLDEELGLERVGVVEVLLVARVERELGEVAVVEVERKEGGVELGGELARQRGFAGAGTAGDADDERPLGKAELFGVGRHDG